MRVSQMTAGLSLSGLSVRNDEVDALVDAIRVTLQRMWPRPGDVDVQLIGVGTSFGEQEEPILPEMLQEAERRRRDLLVEYWRTPFFDFERRHLLTAAHRLGHAISTMDEERIRRAMPPTYMVIRSDDNGLVFTVEDGLTWTEAHKLEKTMTARGHKQTYSVISYTDDSKSDVLELHGVQLVE